MSEKPVPNQTDEEELKVPEEPADAAHLIDAFIVSLSDHIPKLKEDALLVEKLKVSLTGLFESFDASALEESVKDEIERLGDRISRTSRKSEVEKGKSRVAPPSPQLLVSLQEMKEGTIAGSKDMLSQFNEEMVPLVKAHGQATFKKMLEDTLLMLYKYISKKLSGVIVPSLVEVIGNTMMPEAKTNKDLEQLTRYLVEASLGIVPKTIQGKSVQKETTSIAKKFTSKAGTVLVKVNAPEDCDINQQNVEKMIDIVLNLGYNMVFNVMMGDKKANTLVMPVIKEVFIFAGEALPNDLPK